VTAPIHRRPFDRTPDGETVDLFTLGGPGGVEASIMTYGAALQSLLAPDSDGYRTNVCLGFETLAGYTENSGHYFGATVGRYANRIAGARFALDGVVHELDRNDGKSCLHGGTRGFDRHVWDVVDAADGVLRLAYSSPHAEMGFPGDLDVRVEYRLEDVYQVQVHKKAGLTFASGLRAILRSDPDVLMVGEVRDLETAKIALEAALTGHAVLSTMHANDAPAAITRLNDMGIEPFVTGSAVTAVLAQRLVRQLCPECREPYESSAEDLEFLGYTPEQIAAGITLYRRRGCHQCVQGYKGRTGVYQLMVMNDELQKLTGQRASHGELYAAAEASGMKSLWEDGLEKAAAGVTTIEELTRVIR